LVVTEEWKALTVHEQAAFRTTAVPADLGPAPSPTLAQARPNFGAGDAEWPVAPRVLTDFVGKCSGLAGTGFAMRKQTRSSLVSTDDSERIPAARRFCHRYACHDRHPGLCFTAHADIYTEVVKFGRSFEQLAGSVDLDSSFLKVTGCHADGSGTNTKIVYLAGRRARRPYAPQVLVFAYCTEGAVRDDGVDVHFAEASPESGTHTFCSVWLLGVVLMRAGAETINVLKGDTSARRLSAMEVTSPCSAPYTTPLMSGYLHYCQPGFVW
jgi:hypothetical protein